MLRSHPRSQVRSNSSRLISSQHRLELRLCGDSTGIQLFTQHLAQQGNSNGLIISVLSLTGRQRLSKRSVDHGLVTRTFGFGLATKELDNIVIEHDCDAGLARRRNERSTLALRKIVLLTH